MFGNTQNSFDSVFVCRTKPIKAHQPKMCILYAQILVKPKKSILFAKALSPLALSPLPTPLPSWANVHPHSVAFSVSWVEQRVGFERGDIKACCKLRRGNLVVRITFWTFFARPNPYLPLCAPPVLWCASCVVVWYCVVWCCVVVCLHWGVEHNWICQIRIQQDKDVWVCLARMQMRVSCNT